MGLSQQLFADQVGIKRQRLASYEEGRVALRYDLGLRICHHFLLSEKWLATGQGPARLVMDLARENIANRIPADASFYSAYVSFLAGRYEQLAKEMHGVARIAVNADDNLFFVRNLFFKTIEDLISILSERDAFDLLAGLLKVAVKLSESAEKTGRIPDLLELTDISGAEYLGALEGARENELTSVHASVKHESVKAQWPILKKRLQAATAETGGKTKLADFLGEKLASVSQWLTDSDNAREPGAETALRMLYWVEHQRSK